MIHYSEAPEAVKLLEETAKRHKQTKNWTQASNDIKFRNLSNLYFDTPDGVSNREANETNLQQK